MRLGTVNLVIAISQTSLRIGRTDIIVAITKRPNPIILFQVPYSNKLYKLRKQLSAVL